MKRRVLQTAATTALVALLFLSGCFLWPNAPPVAIFTTTPPEGSAPLSVRFDASGSYDPDGAVTAYAWSFGDGTSGSGTYLTHVYLSPGSYTVQLTVSDKRHASVTASSVVTARPGANYAIVVGIADYARMRSLKFPDDDAAAIAEKLGSLPGWTSEHIELLLNAEATTTRFMGLLDGLRGRTQDDLVYVFFSGHGNRVRDLNGDEYDGFDEVLCFYDADLSDDTLAQWLGSLPVGRMVVMLDACYSGGQLHSLAVKDGNPDETDGLLEDLERARLAQPQDLDRLTTPLVALSASRFNQLSWELASLRHGIFAYAVLEALGGLADDGGDRDRMTSAEECFSYVAARVPSLGKTGGVAQAPQMLDLYPGELEFAGVP